MLYLHGVLNANSRFIIQGWKSPFSNAENPGAAKNGAEPEKAKQAQLRETCDSTAETRSKLDVKQVVFVQLLRNMQLAFLEFLGQS
ncbi:MAG TPA: hypothetical protein VK536_04220 [Candidatus Limnocylindrales bacterium]|nr:hypothetical protein [Candidatus Limnocylindrales bacterium]